MIKTMIDFFKYDTIAVIGVIVSCLLILSIVCACIKTIFFEYSLNDRLCIVNGTLTDILSTTVILSHVSIEELDTRYWRSNSDRFSRIYMKLMITDSHPERQIIIYIQDSAIIRDIYTIGDHIDFVCTFYPYKKPMIDFQFRNCSLKGSLKDSSQ